MFDQLLVTLSAGVAAGGGMSVLFLTPCHSTPYYRSPPILLVYVVYLVIYDAG